MMRLPLLTVAPEVVDLFGGPDATRTLLAEMFGGYRCTVCGNPGTLDTDAPAAVVVVIHDGGTGPLAVRLAHPGCSDSGIVTVTEPPTPNGSFTIPAMAWLRPGYADPPAVVVVGPRVTARHVTAGGDMVDRLLSSLLAEGFTLLTDPLTPLAELPGGPLRVEYGPGQQIKVTDGHGGYLYDGQLPVPDGWAETIQTTGRLGVVVASGLDLFDPARDHLADLFTAIYEGMAVGAAVAVDPLSLTVQ